MRQLILANISLINVKGLYNYIEECVYKSMCVCVCSTCIHGIWNWASKYFGSKIIVYENSPFTDKKYISQFWILFLGTEMR